MQACQVCATKIGIIPMPPSRRPHAPCTRCNSLQFMRVIPREHTTTRIGDTNTQLSAPLFLTHAPSTYHGFFGSHVKEIEVEETGYGLLETFICRKCGLVEWYCHDIERMPAHPHLMSEAIDYESDAPYR